MWNHFFKHIDIDPKNVHILDGNASNLIEECIQYEKDIAKAGGIELFVGGIGPDGHIAFNEPGTAHFFAYESLFCLHSIIDRFEFGLTNACEDTRSRHHHCQCSLL